MSVEQLPANGSSTVSPANENIRIRRSASSGGYGAGVRRVLTLLEYRVHIDRNQLLNLGSRKHGELPLRGRWGPIAHPLAKEKNVLNVILDHATRLVRLSVVTGAVSRGLMDTIGDLLPDHRGETVQTKRTGADLDVGVERGRCSASRSSAGHAHVADHTAEPSSWNSTRSHSRQTRSRADKKLS